MNKPPSQVGWLTSLRAIIGIWRYLSTSKGFISLRPRSLNQDALENLFGAIRGGCGSGDNPTAVQFAASLKTQILNGLTNQAISGTNCEDDEQVLLSNLVAFINVAPPDIEYPDTIETTLQSEISNPVEIANYVANCVSTGMTQTLSVAYVSGFIVKRILEKLHCDICQDILLSQIDTPHNLFITFKEWSESEHRLCYPAEDLVVSVGHGVTVIEDTLDIICTQPKVGQQIAEKLKNTIDFSWLTCEIHKQIIVDSIVIALCKISIPWWCKRKLREHREERKDSRATKRKLKKFQH